MARLFGREWKREELLDRLEVMEQLIGARQTHSIDGPEQGSGAIDLWNSSGLRLTVLPGRCLDIAYADYKGVPLCYRGAGGETGPAFYEPQGNGWLRGYFGGLVTTCGLTHVGDPEIDPEVEKTELGLHGRIAFAPARRIAISEQWEGDNYIVRVGGQMRESASLGVNLQMTRQIEFKLGESRLIIHDKVVNMTRRHRSPLMVVYHCNLGFPILDAGARLIMPPSRAQFYRGGEASREQYTNIPAPSKDSDDVVLHDLKPNADGTVTFALANEKLGNGLGIYWCYKKSDLPILSQWQHFAAGEYVMGIEPGNCNVLGRAANRKAGTLQYIEPGEERTFTLEIGILDGREAIQKFEAAMPKS